MTSDLNNLPSSYRRYRWKYDYMIIPPCGRKWTLTQSTFLPQCNRKSHNRDWGLFNMPFSQWGHKFIHCRAEYTVKTLLLQGIDSILWPTLGISLTHSRLLWAFTLIKRHVVSESNMRKFACIRRKAPRSKWWFCRPCIGWKSQDKADKSQVFITNMFLLSLIRTDGFSCL